MPMNRRRKQPTIAILCCGGAVSVFVLIWRLYPRERTLLELARSVTPLDTTLMPFGRQREEGRWLTDSRLLIKTTDQTGMASVSNWRGHADLFDIATGTRACLVGLTRRINWGWLVAPGRLEPSLDGTWLIWIIDTPRGSIPGFGCSHPVAKVQTSVTSGSNEVRR